MSDAVRVEDDLGLAGKVAIVTGGGAPMTASATAGRRRCCWPARASR